MRSALIAASAAVVVSTVSSTSLADLNLLDPSIINLYQLNEQTSGDLNNEVSDSFKDTAETGTEQNHENLSVPAPAWVSTPGIGDGTGLQFDRSNTEYTRFQPWQNVTQGNYVNGGSYTAMVRLNLGTVAGDQTYNIMGNSSNHLQINTGGAGTAYFKAQLRDGSTGEPRWGIDSGGLVFGADGNYSPALSQNSSGSTFTLTPGVWTNLFVIYDADNQVLTVAGDDGTTYASQSIATPPTGFDTTDAAGFSDAGAFWFLGSLGSPTSTLNGTIEAIAFWDRALTGSEADGIGFTWDPLESTCRHASLSIL